MQPEDSVIPKFYGLPKVHKDRIPLRPIAALRCAPTYNLAKWLFLQLNDLVSGFTSHGPQHSEFLSHIKDVCNEDAKIMVSFDITALFTCIPIDRARRILEAAITADQYLVDNSRLGQTQLLSLVDLCLTTTYFCFGGQIYHQRQCTPMGSPISGLIVELVMQHFEQQALHGDNMPKLWLRYIDDMFTIIERESFDRF